MSILRDLLAIKTFREHQAESALRQQRQALAEADATRAQAQELLQRLLREGHAMELSLYRELCARLVRLREIEDVQLTVAGLRQREAAQHEAVEAAERAQREHEAQLDAARATHREAARQKSKFVDLARDYAATELREAERREDLEMEEAASVARDREDWQGHDQEEVA